MPKRSTRKRRGPRPVPVPSLNVHPGALLRDEFMKPLHLTPEILAAAIPRHPEFPDSDVAEQIRELVRADEDSSLDLDLALALDRYFGLSPGYFWRGQAEQEIRDWLHRDRLWLARIKPFRWPIRQKNEGGMALEAPLTSYGVTTVTTNRKGDLVLHLPMALVRDFGARPGDTVTFNRRKAGGWFCRFYRRTRNGWRRLMIGGRRRTVRYPR